MFKHIKAHVDLKVQDGQISNHSLFYFQNGAKTQNILKTPRGP